MKMVKGLLLGSAAGVIAVAGAQAADLPVKAKPVEYVKVCSLYGVGYYYIPGTDVCMRVGGYVRAEYSYGYGASMTVGPFAQPSSQAGRISDNDFVMRSRAYITTETRQQTAYGTLRTFLNVGLNYDSPAGAAISANRAFIQIAGFTIGLATSYYDFYAAAATSYLQLPSSDTGDGGWKVFAYTAQIGNGWSASLSLEEPRRSVVTNTALAQGVTGAFNANNTTVGASFNDPFLVGNLPTDAREKINAPDIVAALRVDQAWGSAQVMGAAGVVGGSYYGTSLVGPWNNGHPDSKIGWAVGAGIKINFPMIAPGDYFQMQVNYAQGAVRYAGFTQPGTYSPARFNGNELGLGYMSDGIFCGGNFGGQGIRGCSSGSSSDIQLTTAFGVNAAYEHFWTPSLRTSLWGAYLKVTYNDAAKGMIDDATCGDRALSGGSSSQPAAPSGSLTGITNCNPDWSWWGIGSRTQWNVTKDFYMGVDVYYTKLQTGFEGYGNYRAAAGSSPATGRYTITDQDVVGTRVRFHRDIVP